MSVPRPFRAVAYVPDPTGQETGRSRKVAGHTSAKRRAGLDRFVNDYLGRGNVVELEEVRTLLEEIPT